MSDFKQNGPITTLHRLPGYSLEKIENDLRRFAKRSPMRGALAGVQNTLLQAQCILVIFVIILVFTKAKIAALLIQRNRTFIVTAYFEAHTNASALCADLLGFTQQLLCHT